MNVILHKMTIVCENAQRGQVALTAVECSGGFAAGFSFKTDNYAVLARQRISNIERIAVIVMPSKNWMQTIENDGWEIIREIKP